MNISPCNHSKMLSLSTLLKSGFTPTLTDFNNFLLFLSRNHKFKATIQFFSQLTSNKINTDAQTHTFFAKALLKENNYEEAADFIKKLVGDSKIFHKNRVFDSLIQGLCTFNQDPDKGFYLLRDFSRIDGFFPSSRTFCLLICCFSRMGKMDRVIDLLELMSDDIFKYPFDNFICSSVISGFVRIGEPELAVGFYENAVKSGSLRPNVVTCTNVVSAYCKLRKLNKVSDLVAWMENNELGFDVVFYSNWIYGCFSEGLVHEAFQKFSVMVDKKVELDNISYTILIDGFSKDGNVEKAVGFLHKMRNDGLEPNLVTYTAIINGYCKKGKLEEAFAIFGMIKRLGIDADEFTYAILINGFCRRGNYDIVQQLLDEMQQKDINPSVVTYNTVINGLSKAGRTSEADDFSKIVVGDAFTYSTLLQGYVKENNNMGILETKRRLEKADIQMDIVLCNVLLKALLMVGLFEDAFEIYKGLHKMDLSANCVTYFTLIDGFCKAGRADEALEIFDEFRRSSNSSAACYDSILRRLLFEGKMLLAQLILTSFLKIYGISDLRACEIVVYYLCLHNVKKAQLFLSTMNDRKSSIAVPISVFKALINDNRVEDAYELSMGTESYLLDINVAHYSIVIDALCKTRQIKKALDLCASAKTKGINLNIVTYNTVINGLCMHGCLVEAFRLFDSLERNNLPPTEITYGTLIDALVKEGLLKDAKILFERMFVKNLSPGPHIYNSLIDGYCKANLLKDAMEIFRDLEVRDFEPNGFTVSALINGYCMKGEMEGALKLFFEFKSRGLLPDFLGFVYLVRGLCAKGRMEESRSILREMLKIESVVDMLNTVKTEDELGSVGEMVFLLCERGCINEAVDVLNEVVSVLFSGERDYSSHALLNPSELKPKAEILPLFDRRSDFETFYCNIRSLCLKGELAEANRLAKLLIEL
ncbi:hypothetical protein CASFOL_032310 [Castilleja foliolosa]|uniref:Pentatricopeptide repeat-containing protein n=1 Tax=Castilleja foliolosa TaxID=1961234 RepID=A0ABD3C207_9LAMI